MSGDIFISYRRSDSSGSTGRIYDRLQQAFSPDLVFMDIDGIAPGADFVAVLNEKVAACQVVVVIIGRDWVTALDDEGRLRLDSDDDFVRVEIEAALERSIPIIPLLVDGAVMPRISELPDSLKALARRQGIRVSHDQFSTDVERLVSALRGIVNVSQLAATHARQSLTAPAIVLSKETVAAMVDHWTGKGVYVFHKTKLAIDDRHAPTDVLGSARAHLAVPSTEYLAAAFLSFENKELNCGLAVCQSGLYHCDHDRKEYISFSSFIASPLDTDVCEVTLGGRENLRLQGYSFSFDERAVLKMLRDLKAKIENEHRFGQAAPNRS